MPRRLNNVRSFWLVVLISLLAIDLQGQVTIQTIPPQDVEVCGGQRTVDVQIDVASLVEQVQVTLNLVDGLQYVEGSGVLSSCGTCTPDGQQTPGHQVFMDLPNLSVGQHILSFDVVAGCNLVESADVANSVSLSSAIAFTQGGTPSTAADPLPLETMGVLFPKLVFEEFKNPPPTSVDYADPSWIRVWKFRNVGTAPITNAEIHIDYEKIGGEQVFNTTTNGVRALMLEVYPTSHNLVATNREQTATGFIDLLTNIPAEGIPPGAVISIIENTNPIDLCAQGQSMQTDIVIRWGCGNEILCDAGGVQAATHSHTIFVEPAEFEASFIGGAGSPRPSYGQTGSAVFNLANTGRVDIPGETMSMSISKTSDIAITNLVIDGVAQPALAPGNNYVFSGTEYFSGVQRFQDIDISFDYTPNCPPGNTTSEFINVTMDYGGGCGLPLEEETIRVVDQIIDDRPPLLSGPADLDFVEGQSATSGEFTFDIESVVSANELKALCSNLNNDGYVQLRIDLPPNIAAVGAFPTLNIQNGNALSITGMQDLGNQKITFDLTGEGASQFYTNKYSIDLELFHDCNNPSPPDQFYTVNWTLERGCYAPVDMVNACVTEIASGSWEYFGHFTCAGDPPSAGPDECYTQTTSFDVQRSSFGKLNGNTDLALLVDDFNALPDAQLGDITDLSSLKRGFACDEFEVTLSGTFNVQGACTGVSGAQVHGRIIYEPLAGQNAILELINGSASLTIDQVPVNLIVPTGATYEALDNVYVFDFTIDQPTLLANSDLELKASFKVPANAGFADNHIIQRFRGMWQLNDPGLFDDDSRGDIVRLLNPNVANIVAVDEEVCLGSYSVSFIEKGGTSNDFPDEFRPVNEISDFSLDVPQGMNAKTGTSKILVTSSEGGNELFAIGDPILGSNTLTWSRDALTWPVVDMNAEQVTTKLLFEMDIDCTTEDGGQFTGAIQYDHGVYDVACLETGQNEALNPKQDPRERPLIATTISRFEYLGNGEVNLYASIRNDGGWQNSQGIDQEAWLAIETDDVIAVNSISFDGQAPLGGITFYDEGLTTQNKAFAVLPVDPIGANTVQEVVINMIYSNCVDLGANSLELFSNWECGPNAFDFNTFAPRVSPVCGEVQITTASFADRTVTLSNVIQNMDEVNICEDEVVLNSIITSTGNTQIDVLEARLVMPNGITFNSNYAPRYKVEGVHTNFQTVDLTGVTDPATEWWDVLNNSGLTITPGQMVTLEFAVSSTCDYFPLDLVRLETQASAPCGEQSSATSSQRRLLIDGITAAQPGAVGLSMTVDAQIGEVGGTADVNISFLNNSSQVLNDGVLTILLPSELGYAEVIGTGIAPDEITPVSGGTQLVWEIQQLAVGSSFSGAKFSVQDRSAPMDGPEVTISADVTISTSLFCDNNSGQHCDLVLPLTSRNVQIQLPSATDDEEFTCENCLKSLSPEVGQEYVISAWVKQVFDDGSKVPSYDRLGLQVRFDNGGAKTFRPSGEIIDGWQRIEGIFTIPQSASKMSIIARNSIEQSTSYLDDVRIHPFNGNMKSFVYDPVSLRLTAELDENNYATFYEYDEEGALIRVKKETERGIKTIQESRNNTAKRPLTN